MSEARDNIATHYKRQRALLKILLWNVYPKEIQVKSLSSVLKLNGEQTIDDLAGTDIDFMWDTRRGIDYIGLTPAAYTRLEDGTKQA